MTDEFYTRIEDIEREMIHYRDQFRGKRVLLNCNDLEWSSYWRYFERNFDFLGLESLTGTGYAPDGVARKVSIVRGFDRNGDGLHTREDAEVSDLGEHGDFRSYEMRSLVAESDIVVTTPPNAGLDDYLSGIIESGVQFILLVANSAITRRGVWGEIHAGRVWTGVTDFGKNRLFHVPDGYDFESSKFPRREDRDIPAVLLPGSFWLTNVEHDSREHEPLFLHLQYDAERYPRYDNFDAIEVSRVSDIPEDYDGVMGVPITFLGKHDERQFDILGLANGAWCPQELRLSVPGGHSKPRIGGKNIAQRILIRRSGVSAHSVADSALRSARKEASTASLTVSLYGDSVPHRVVTVPYASLADEDRKTIERILGITA